MKKLQMFKHKKLVSAIAVVTGATVLSVASLAWAAPSIDVSLSGGSMSITTASDSALYVRIAGPNDYFKELRGDDAKQWYPEADAPDGLYRYDSYSSPKEEKVEGAVKSETKLKGFQKSGSFTLENGMIVEPQPQQNINEQYKKQSSAQPKSFLEKALISVLDTIVPSANAANLTASSGQPQVNFDDTNYGGVEWRLEGNQYNSNGGGYTTDDGYFVLFDYLGANDHEVIHIDGTVGETKNLNSLVVDKDGVMKLANGTVIIDATTKTNSIRVYDTGDVSLGQSAAFFDISAPVHSLAVYDDGKVRLGKNAVLIDGGATAGAIAVDANNNVNLGNSAVFVDKANKRLGVGTTTPTAKLHIIDPSNAGVRLDNGSEYFDIAQKGGDFSFDFNNGTTTRIMTVENDDTYCGGAGGTEKAPCVGFFRADNPEASVHIKKNDGKTRLLVEEASPTTAQRFTVEMKNNGGTGFLITNTSKPASQWQFSSQPNEAFTASFIGTGGPEMQVRKDGAVQFGPGNVVNFNLTANGHMTLLHGSATATTFITSSSRDVKKDFKKVNPEGILQKIKNLDITQWRYKNENEKGRHIGPMAEDFYKLFKLGADNKHVLGTDMASIAIVAAKELHEKASLANAETIQLKQETAKLKAENTKLKERMASLEKLVTNLASADGSLKESGKKIALAK